MTTAGEKRHTHKEKDREKKLLSWQADWKACNGREGRGYVHMSNKKVRQRLFCLQLVSLEKDLGDIAFDQKCVHWKGGGGIILRDPYNYLCLKLTSRRRAALLMYEMSTISVASMLSNSIAAHRSELKIQRWLQNTTQWITPKYICIHCIKVFRRVISKSKQFFKLAYVTKYDST